jgi:hypothetical protein
MSDPFSGIILINDNDSEIQKEMNKEMNASNVIRLNFKYPEGIECICGKKIKNYGKHVESAKHKRFVNKHNICIEVITPPRGRPRVYKEPKVKKAKVPKPPKVRKPIGRPKIYVNETEEQMKERKNKYMVSYLDNNEEKRKKQNERVALFREKNRELCRQRVRDCRARKKAEKLKNKN